MDSNCFNRNLIELEEEEIKQMVILQNTLEGPDIYWNGYVRDDAARKTQTTDFMGRLIIKSFPFTIFMQYDGSDEMFLIEKELYGDIIELQTRQIVIDK
jgi:hypothetical protein